MGSTDRALHEPAIDEPLDESAAVPKVPGQPPLPSTTTPDDVYEADGVTAPEGTDDTAELEAIDDDDHIAVADDELDDLDDLDDLGETADEPHSPGADADGEDEDTANLRDRALRTLAGLRRSPVVPPPAALPAEPRQYSDAAVVPAAPVRRTIVDAERHLIAPVVRSVGRRPRVRKVTRVLRHVDPWSVFKVAAVFSMVVYGVVLTAGVLLWNVAHSTGTVDNVEQFFESFGWSDFQFEGGEIYHNAWIGGLFVAVALTGFAVLGATLFNLITDLVGGVRMTVLEEEVVERTESPTRRFTVRRTPPERPGDGSGLVDSGDSLRDGDGVLERTHSVEEGRADR